MNRWRDWWEQSERDLQHAHHALGDRDCEWAAFASQQAAEKAPKALKALVLAHGGEPWGHLLTALVEALPAATAAPVQVLEAAKRLDKHYIPSRYPNGFDAGFPGKLYTKGEAEGAIADAAEIIEFCGRNLPG